MSRESLQHLREMKLTRKLFVAILLTAILVSSVVTYIFASSSTITYTISAGNYPGAPNYTVWSEGTNYFAKNASGVTAFSGTDPTSVLQSVMSVIGGGKIFIQAGIYLFTTPLYILSNVTLIGSGLEFNGYYGTVFYQTFNESAQGWHALLTFQDGTQWAKVEDIHFRLAGGCSGHAVEIYGRYNTINHCMFSYFNNDTIRILNGTSYSYENWVTKNMISGCGGHGIYVSSSENYIEENVIDNSLAADATKSCVYVTNYWGNIIYDNHFMSGKVCTGVELSSTTSSTKIMRNWFDNLYEGLRARGYGHMVVDNEFAIAAYNNLNWYAVNSTIENNKFSYASYATTGYSEIVLQSGANANLISGNQFTGLEYGTNLYGAIKELSGADYNVIIGDYAYYVNAPAIIKTGSNTKVDLCWNGTNWIS
jgi:parallel beta-helix repeat protein